MGGIVATSDGRGTAEVISLSLPRRAMVRAVEKALEAPCFALRRSVSLAGLVACRSKMRDEGQLVPSINDYLLRAAGLALREHPVVNASFLDGKVIQYSRVNVGVAIAVPGGLVAPAVYDVDLKDAAHVGHDVRQLVERAQNRSLNLEVLRDATLTVSNLGMFGIEDFDPLVNLPQAAILGVGAVDKGSTKSMRLSLVCDHRVLTGVEGAMYLQTLCDLLEDVEDTSRVLWKEGT